MKILKFIKSFKNQKNRSIKFKDIKQLKTIYLYAGDIPAREEYNGYIGLSINQNGERHIKHDITRKCHLPDNCVDRYQSEDVFEHITLKKLPGTINEIYRILKPGGLFRLSVPDYRCNLLYERTLKNISGDLLFDPEGGGIYKNGKVINSGHQWFPKYETVKNLLEKSLFSKIIFYHYYNEFEEAITNKIDYSKGYIMRTPDNDERVQNPYRPFSLVVDCIK